MRKVLLLFAMLLCSSYWFAAYAETEPNNDKASANVMTLNGSDAGSITVNDVDWYSITTNADGALTVNVQSTSTTCLYLQLFDSDGNAVLNTAAHCGGNFASVTVDGLATGTYFVSVQSYYPGQTLSYNISNSFSAATPANDQEPNSTIAQAQTLPLNGAVTGHAGFRYNNARDNDDYFKVTTNADGKLQLSINSTNNNTSPACLFMELLDNDGVTQLNNTSNCGSGVTTIATDGLAAGTYYVHVKPYYAGQFITYTLSDTLIQPAIANDAEPNNGAPTAISISLTDSVTGHVGYYYNQLRDNEDWYKVTTNADGKIEVSIQSNNDVGTVYCVYLQLLDNNGITELATSSNCGGTPTVLSLDGLAQGTYYLRVSPYYSGQYVAYSLRSNIVAPASANDAEPNDDVNSATLLPVNFKTTGHTGYYYNNRRDSADFYKIVTNKDGRVKATILSDNNVGTVYAAYLELRDSDGSTVISSTSNTGGAPGEINVDGLAAGTYYLMVRSYYTGQYLSYTLTDSLFIPAIPNDNEPNDSMSAALTLAPNGTANGHMGYYNSGKRDSEDWYKITAPVDGAIQLGVSSNNSQGTVNCVYVQLFNSLGTQLNTVNNCGGAASSITTDGLGAGVYYVRVTSYYSGQFETYTLTSTHQTYNPNDVAPNDAPYMGRIISANTTASGHIGFVTNGVSDTQDWWRIAYTGTGNLDFQVSNSGTATTTSCLAFDIFRDTAAAAIYSGNNCGGAATTVNLTGLTVGVYYVRVRSYYSGQFTTYTLNPAFVEVNNVGIGIPAYVAPTTCAGNNGSLTLRCGGGIAPYTVQLYKNGAAFGAPRSISNTSLFMYANLGSGIYYATATGTGASQPVTSSVVGLVPAPAGLGVTNVTTNSARATWTALPCVDYYSFQYRAVGSPNYILRRVNKLYNFLPLQGLLPNTTYECRVAAADTMGTLTGNSVYSNTIQFTTASSFAAMRTAPGEVVVAESGLSVYPNPAIRQFTVSFQSVEMKGRVTMLLRDVNGRTVWTKAGQPSSAINNTVVDVSKLTPGIYLLQLIGEDAATSMTTTKVIVK